MKISTPSDVSAQTPDYRQEQIKNVAREFESMFTSMMLRAMRNTVNDAGLIPNGTGAKIYTGMLDEEYSKISSLGLSNLIIKELENYDNPEDVLKGLSGGTTTLINDVGSTSNPLYTSNERPLSKNQLTNMQKWLPLIKEASQMYNLDPELISAVIIQESGGNPYAVSRAGAKGLMQLMDSTAQELGVQEVFSPRENIMAGSKYLRKMLDRFGDETLALASYNAGPGAVAKYNGIPPYRETQGYVQKVKNLRSQIFATVANKE
jgi:soluble lytic murein transglycosylase-like protein